MRPDLASQLRYFKNQFKSKWERYNRHKDRFLSNESSWLDEDLEFTVFTPKKGGRPFTSFNDSSENTKRRKTLNLRSEFDADVLTYAAQMKLRAAGKSTEADVIKKVAEIPRYAKDCLNMSSTAKTKVLSPREALSLIVEAQLSRSQYEKIREYAIEIFPSYKQVQSEKLCSYPNNIKVTESIAEVPLQSLLKRHKKLEIKILNLIERSLLEKLHEQITLETFLTVYLFHPTL
jgi:hypothetical protein